MSKLSIRSSAFSTIQTTDMKTQLVFFHIIKKKKKKKYENPACILKKVQV